MDRQNASLFFSTHRRQRRRGQAITEFALVLPILLLTIFGIIEFARVYQSYLVISNAARFGVRYAVTGEYKPEYCEDTDDGPDAQGVDGPCAGAARIAEEDHARLLSIYDEVLNQTGSIPVAYYEDIVRGFLMGTPPEGEQTPGYLLVSVCSTRSGYAFDRPNGRCRNIVSDAFEDDPGNPEEGQTRVIVSVTFQHPLILPFLSNLWPSLRLRAERSGILEQFRVARVLGLPPDISIYFTRTPTNTPTPSETPTPTESPTPTQSPTPSPSPTNTPTPSPTPTSTFTPSPTPTADCNQVEVWNYGLDHFDVAFDIRNNDPYYSAALSGMNSSWSGGWHDELTPTPPAKVFQGYTRESALIDDRPDVPLLPGFNVAHSGFSGDVWTLLPNVTTWFGLNFSQTFDYSYYHGRDFTTTLNYQMVSPDEQVRIDCPPVNLIGRYGPVVQPTLPANPISGPFSISASAVDPDGQIEQVYFVVRNQLGSVVGYQTDTAAPYCLFGQSGANCTTRTLGDRWPNSTQTIQNGTYSISIQALDRDGNPLYHYTRVVRIFNVYILTPTRTPTRTITPIPTITRTPTITLTPTITRNPTITFTPTITPTPTRTLTPTITRTPTRTPTITPTSTITLTPTITRTPTRTSTPTITLTPTRTPTVTLTPTITLTPTVTPKPSLTPTPTNTPTRTTTPTRTPTRTPTPTETPLITNTPTATWTQPPPQATRTPTPTPTRTPRPTTGGGG